MDSLSGLLVALSEFLVVIVIVAVILYVFTALALFTMAKNKGIDHAWFAWIPVLQNYLQGELIDDVVPFFSPNTLIPYAKWILLGGAILVSCLSQVQYLGTILAVVYAVYYYLALYRLYKLYDADHCVVYTVLSIIFAVTGPFFMFAIRNNTPVEYLSNVGGSNSSSL